MAAKKKQEKNHLEEAIEELKDLSFTKFFQDPIIYLSLTAFGLVALVFTIMEFSESLMLFK